MPNDMKAMVWTLALAAIAGIASWRMQRRRGRWRSLFDETPAGMTKDQFERRQELRFQVRRMLVSLLIAAMAAALGFALSSWTIE